MKIRRLQAILVKEFRQLRRDRISLAMIIGIPVLQLLLFGYAINMDVRGIAAAVADQSGTAQSRTVIAEMLASGVIEVKEQLDSEQALRSALQAGRVSVGLYVPHDFIRRGQEGRPQVLVLADGSDNVVQQAVRQLLAVSMQPDHWRLSPGAPELLYNRPAMGAVQVVSFYNPERRSAVNVVPALIGVILTMTMVMFTAMAIVREQERGQMELLITTPVSRLELMLGKVLPYVMIGLLQTTLVLALGVSVFAVPIRGALVDVYLAALLLICANLTLGLLISTRAQSQFQAMQMTFFVFLPSLLLSGFMFPFDGMPKAAQWIAEVLPLTHFVRLVRGVMLRGADLLTLWGDVLALMAFTAVMLAAAVSRFKKRLD